MKPVEFMRECFKTVRPALAFGATDAAGLAEWQTKLRAKLGELLGLPLMQDWRCEPAPEMDDAEDLGDYTRRRMTLQTAPGYRMPLYVLQPKTPGPWKPVLALHGHGGGKCDVCGIAETGTDAARQRVHNYHYAVEAVRHGYLVFAPDKRGFGETVEERDREAGRNSSCEWQTMAAALLGMSTVGLHVWDNQRLLDYIATREDCIHGAVAAFGVSGGGQATLYLSAVDERVSVAVVSGHLGSFASSILLTDGCMCNTIPGLLRWAEKGDVAGLIAPRPLLVESASHDQCYSRVSQLDSYEIVKRIYAVAGVPERLDIDLFEGPHEWSGRKAWDWLARWM